MVERIGGMVNVLFFTNIDIKQADRTEEFLDIVLWAIEFLKSGRPRLTVVSGAMYLKTGVVV